MAKDEFKKKSNRQVTVIYYFWKWFYHEFYKRIDFSSDLSPLEQIQFNTVTYINAVDKAVLSDRQSKTTLMQILKVREAEKRMESRAAASEPESDSADDSFSCNGVSMDDIDDAILREDGKMDIWDDGENKLNLLIISTLGYSFDASEPAAYRGDISSIVNEDPRNLKKRIRNEEIDRLLRKLDYSGKSGITDQKFVCRKMCENVLSKPKEEWQSAFNALWNDLYKGVYEYEDNHTIFKIGIPQMLEMFKAFSVSDPKEGDWLRLLEFYFEVCRQEATEAERTQTAEECKQAYGFEQPEADENGKASNWKIVARKLQPLNYVQLNNHPRAYFAVLREFNKAEIVGNLNLFALRLPMISIR